MAFGENVDPSAAIRAIIGSYPFSAGIFRELLQNSDDAGAKKQMFILDHRIHHATSLHHPNLSEMQGPALLAYNDALFTEEDWTALQNIHRSSKRTDTSKIGKYGIGFRSSYHVTDGPQILSGPYLAILDPLHRFSDSGGVKLDYLKNSFYADHISAFDAIPPDLYASGSIIRLPLRKIASDISTKPVHPLEIRSLLCDFINDEISIALLFLENVVMIEVYEVDAHGDTHRLAMSTITRASKVVCAGQSATFTCSVKTVAGDSAGVVERWRIQETLFSQGDAINALSERLGSDASPALKKHKLKPHVALAISLTTVTDRNTSGRLFTYLPLPLPTGFPVHIHSLFALTTDRQHLRNGHQTGLVAGSDDRVLVEWNQLLFEVYIPQVWVALLETMLKEDNIPDPYKAWPTTPQLAGQGVPLNVLKHLATSCSPVWPIQPTSRVPHTDYFSLNSVLVSREGLFPGTTEVLSALGLKINCPPPFIFDLLSENKALGTIFMTPKTVHSVLGAQEHILELEKANDAKVSIVLQFLVTGGLTNIINLPLLPTIGGRRVSLTARGSETHILLERVEAELFGVCDKGAIPLDKLESTVAHQLELQGPMILNVQRLTPDVVVRYLKINPSPFGLVLGKDNIDAPVVDWLSKFWTWMGNCRISQQLYPLTTSLHLIPTRNGLRTTDDPIYVEVGVHPILLLNLEKSGIIFLHRDFPLPVRNIVASFSAFNTVNDLPRLLKSISSSDMATLDQVGIQIILNHIIHYARSQPLNKDDVQNLRKLPIFPLLVPPNTTRISNSIPEGKKVLGIAISTLDILPVARDTIFIDGSQVEPTFVKILNPTAGPHLSDSGLLQWTLDRFTVQPPEIQAGYVKYMAINKNHISSHSIEVLRRIPFVMTSDDARHSPQEVIDPQSVIGPLFTGSLDRLPLLKTEFDSTIVSSLRALSIMPHTLTTKIIEERIRFISNDTSSSRHNISRDLLRIIFESQLDLRSLKIPSEYRWLPTRQGLLGPDECRDVDSPHVLLFDEVLPILDDGIKITSSLRAALRWNQPLTMSVLTRQLSRVLETKNAYRKVRALIKEFSQRTLDAAALNDIHNAISGRPWVPLANGDLGQASDSVFVDAEPKVDFFQILFSNINRPLTRRFLLSMGCHERPTENAIGFKLQTLRRQPPSSLIAQKALLLLRLLPETISDTTRSQALVPDTSFQLLPASSVFYNDIGERLCFIDLGAGDINVAHEWLDEHTARLLGMRWLGHKFTDLQIPGDDMGEQLTTTIRKSLREYTERQFLVEFLANAADAGANDFGVLIDQYQALDRRILCADMASFQRCPSLIIYNDGVFSEADFRGIIKTGIGSKEGRGDSIGQFGLGALTMFHITELVMLVSGEHVLFINPSKECFPLHDRATWRFPLAHIQKFYPDHLDCFNGLFGFDSSSRLPYRGTLFRLPLRSKPHITGSPILAKLWTVRDVEELIQPFEASAHEFMLFTHIKNITLAHRDTTGRLCKLNKVKATYADTITPTTECRSRMIIQRIPPQPHTIGRQEWYVITMPIPSTDLPEYSVPLTAKYRLRSPVSVGLAAQLESLYLDSTVERKLFSVLPLPSITTLPVHLTAPFIMSSDRRQIRLDEYNSSESGYNRWLLSSAIPPLYMTLLEDLAHYESTNKSWWPGNAMEEDPITRILVSSFYTGHLKDNNRLVLCSKYSTRSLSPKDAVLRQSPLPSGLKKVLSLVRPCNLAASLSPRVSSRAIKEAKLAAVGAGFVKNIILHTSDSLGPQLTFEDIHDIIEFIQRDNSVDLTGLPLLPLANGSFTTFEKTPSIAYFTWEHKEKHLFPLNKFVHPHFFSHAKFSTHHLVKNGYNLATLTSTAIKSLIGEQLPERPEWNAPDGESEEWIATFWQEYPRLMPAITDISSFPLVPTTLPGRYISIERCKDRSAVILTSTSETPQIWDLLAHLDLLIVDQYSTQSFPKSLHQILRSDNDTPPFVFRHLLMALRPFEYKLTQMFGQLTHDSHIELAKWARERISSATVLSNLASVARNLPIWPITQTDGSTILSTANHLVMLPRDISEDVAKRFLDFPFSPYQTSLVNIQTKPLTFSEFFARLRSSLPEILPSRDVESYKILLSTMISNSHSVNSNVPVPNCNRVMCLSDTLYARDPLFLAAFVPGSRNFVLEAYRSLEPQLYSLGLKRQANLNATMFVECARAMEADPTIDKVDRAAILFRAYGEDLPLRIRPDSEEWREIDTIRFVPRADGGRTNMWLTIDTSAYTKALPSIVAPNELLLESHEGIAWTQRALFREPPQHRVLIANPTLGCPTMSEVAEHLRILALRLARDHRSNPRVLDDLKQTYHWLDQRSDEARSVMIQFHSEALFINVEDPTQESWEWKAADELVLETDEDLGLYCPVKGFLLPYRNLLVASGVHLIRNAEVPQLTFPVSSDAAQLATMRSVFQEMREEEKLTDVQFSTDEGDLFPAHRSFLATRSTYFYDTFTSSIGRNSQISPVWHISLPGYSGNCVRLVLDYAYTGIIPDFGREDWELLLDMMVLSDYWDFKSLHEAVQLKIIELRVINPLRLAHIKTQAANAQATMVAEACIEYEQKNRHLIQSFPDVDVDGS